MQALANMVVVPPDTAGALGDAQKEGHRAHFCPNSMLDPRIYLRMSGRYIFFSSIVKVLASLLAITVSRSVRASTFQ